MIDLSVVIIAKDEEKLIGGAIKSVKFADEIIVIDTGSSDKTVSIARKLGAKVVKVMAGDLAFAKWRTLAIKKARGNWILYLDADERVTLSLEREILEKIHSSSGKKISAYAIPRENYYLGKRVRFGGSWPDYVKRLFFKRALKRWKGQLHEEPVFRGRMGHLKNPMKHYTHRDISLMLAKTIKWSNLEAKELFNNYPGGHPPMKWWRFLRIMLAEVWHRGIKKKGFLDGTTGVVEVIFQMFSRFITYARLWEMQQLKENFKHQILNHK